MSSHDDIASWTSGNKTIDKLIQEMQLKIKYYDDIKVEWIPFNQFNDIRKIYEDNFNALYSAIWIDCDKIGKKVKSYSIENDDHSNIITIYGISQNPDTKDYVIVLEDCYCVNCDDSISEWIPYNQLNTIKEIDMTLCSAIWINGPIYFNYYRMKLERIPNKKINIKYLDSPLKLTKFNDIKKVSDDDSANILYSATWTNGLLEYDCSKMEYKRTSNKEVILKYSGSNTNNEFLDKVKSYFDEHTIFINGPLCYYNYGKMEWKRDSNKKVTLISLNNLQNTTDQFLNKIKEYIDERKSKSYKIIFTDYFEEYENNNVKVYGISQNPDSKDYIIVLQDWCCEKCNVMYKDKKHKWCNSCQMDNLKQNFANWTSGNEQIDEIVQNLQLDIKKHNDIIFEWIPYNHFNNIKEIVKGDYATLYSANWMNGLLYYEYYKWKRDPNTKVTLKCLHNSQDITDEILNEKIESYYIREDFSYFHNFPKIYGISQNPNTKDYIMVLEDGNHCETCGEIYTKIDTCWCKSCQVNKLVNNFTNWTSGNEIIDKFIQGIQFELKSHNLDISVEWIPYSQFNDIEKIGNDSAILYSATWIDDPLEYDTINWKRISNKKVTLKYLYNSYNITNKSLNEEIKSFTIESDEYNFPIIYGMSQNPDTEDYILVLQDEIFCEKCIQLYTNIEFKKCNPCEINNLKQNFANWTSGNKQIDELIQKMQLESENYDNTVVEWIPYNQLSNIKRTEKIDSNNILYSATWIKCNYEVVLKYLSNLKNNNTDEFLNEIKSCFMEYKSIIKIYGLSQDPSTKDYIVVLQSGIHCEICGELYINSLFGTGFCIWETGFYINSCDGVLCINKWWCKSCQMSVLKNNFENWTSKNKIIDESIQEMQLNIQNYEDIIVEWIPYNQLNDIKEIDSNKCVRNQNNKEVALKNLFNSQNINEFLNEVKSYYFKVDDLAHDINFAPKMYGISQNLDTKDYIIVLEDCYCENCGKGGFPTVYSASWMDGPLRYRKDYKKLERKCNEKVALKCLCNSQNITDGFLHEVKNYSISDDDGILKIYGMSQNPRTKDYIIVLQLAFGNFDECEYIKKSWYWAEKLHILNDIIDCLKVIHDNKMVHRDLHIGNILILPTTTSSFVGNVIQKVCISDMGLCREVCNLDNMDETKVYGVMPYVAPEVLRGKTYTQEADIYSFGMIMYFVATKRQPFANCAHDETLALNICNGIRPEINELEVPKSYIELMKKCWNSNPDDRPKAIEIKEEINKQIEEAEKNKINFSIIGNNKPTHSQAFYTSRLLNPFTKNLRKYDNISNNSVEVIDFTK
ncbi:kinase-like domain-containing protein [Rhizophagus clarus]|uniref:Kinase-like domain-containing protein n=1 Tax=Rhizophagus clarus TaxID=94130 RepID=A0A8H3QH67_9GLOM|nr:kinase-like domain-containing protein [Rhizophagus clarus]